MGRVLSLAGIVVLVLLATALPAGAAVVTNESQPFDNAIFVPCAAGGAGEWVDLSGSLHVLTTLTVNGNVANGVEHFQPQGIRGIGLSTGAVYQATGVTTRNFKIDLTDGSGQTNFVDNFRIVGRGGAVTFSVHETSHVKLASDGTVDVTHDQIDADCA